MKKPKLPRVLLLSAVALAGLIATASIADPFGRDALRQVVAACSIAKSTFNLSFPCTDVQPGAAGADGYAIIRSPGFRSEFLLAPLDAFDGIESPGLLTDAATGFWSAAWAVRSDVAAALGRSLPHDAVALAVNASGTRTQDHFHIHVDCLRQRVGQALAANASTITTDWSQLPTRLVGKSYWVRAIPGDDLKGVNIARLIAAAPPAATSSMNRVTLAVAGAELADGSDGFYLLANWGNFSAERLLDHQCRGR